MNLKLRFINLHSLRLLNGNTTDSEGQTREMDRETKIRRERLDPASAYLSAVLSGKPWPRTQSRPLMSPTNYQDVLQAGSGFFLTVIHAVPSRSVSVRDRASRQTPCQDLRVLSCFASWQTQIGWWFKDCSFLTSKPLWYNKHITCLNKMSFFSNLKKKKQFTYK